MILKIHLYSPRNAVSTNAISTCALFWISLFRFNKGKFWDKSPTCPQKSSTKDNLIGQSYWTALLDSLIGQPYWTALLDSLIGQPYWKNLFHRRDLICTYIYVLHMNLFQLTNVSHNAGFSRNQNVCYVENRCKGVPCIMQVQGMNCVRQNLNKLKLLQSIQLMIIPPSSFYQAEIVYEGRLKIILQ